MSDLFQQFLTGKRLLLSEPERAPRMLLFRRALFISIERRLSMRRFLEVHFLLAVIFFGIAFVRTADAADGLNATIQAMPVNSWLVVPNSKLNDQNDVEAQESDFPGIWHGNNRNANGVFPFSGGAFDSKRDRLLLWGGGHHDYYGNEIYAFNLKDFTWHRLTDPSPPTDRTRCVDILADGNPNCRHTYYNLDYIPEVDCMFSSPAGSTSCGSGGLDRHTWLFDFKAEEAKKGTGWINKGKKDNGKPLVGWSPTASAYDPTSGLVYSVSIGGLSSYDVKKNFWRQLNGTKINKNGGPSDRGMVIDPKRNKIVVVGGGELVVYDLDNEGGKIYQQQVWMTANTPGNEFQSTSAPDGRGRYRPGVNYDPIADRIVVWHGSAVQALNMDTKKWEAFAVAPQKPFASGTYGRFRYSPTQNAYVVVNAGNKEVLIYKLTDMPKKKR